MVESLPADMGRVPSSSARASSALDAAQQTLRELREEQIHDLETALKKLAEERRRSFIIHLYIYVLTKIPKKEYQSLLFYLK